MSSLIAFNKPFNVVTQFSVHEKYQMLKDSYYTNSFLLRVR
jgi:16S rRNA U516 pseudouridylate synthase RsuA-like enzyme